MLLIHKIREKRRIAREKKPVKQLMLVDFSTYGANRSDSESHIHSKHDDEPAYTRKKAGMVVHLS
jgi:hypothetical protein